MKKNIFFSLIFGLLIMSCGSKKESTVDTTPAKPSQGEMDFNALANDVCECMDPIVSVMAKVNQLAKEGKGEELKDYSKKSQGIVQKADKCFRDLEFTYGKIDNITDEAFSVALKNNCPDVADLVIKAKELGKTQQNQ